MASPFGQFRVTLSRQIDRVGHRPTRLRRRCACRTLEHVLLQRRLASSVGFPSLCCGQHVTPAKGSRRTWLYDFEGYESLVRAARWLDPLQLSSCLGGDAGAGDMRALEWTDVNFNKRQLCVLAGSAAADAIMTRC
jgi:hypothetical protein